MGLSNMKNILILFLLILPIDLKAGTADLEISVEYDSSSYVEFSQVGNFELTLKNNGPDAVNNSISINSGTLFQNDLEVLDVSFTTNLDSEHDCNFILGVFDPVPGGSPAYDFTFVFPPIQSGNSVTCYGKLLIGFKKGQKK